MQREPHQPTAGVASDGPADAALVLPVDDERPLLPPAKLSLRQRLYSLWQDSPGWLTSFVVHAILVIFLGTATLTPVPQLMQSFLQVQFSGGDDHLEMDDSHATEFSAVPALQASQTNVIESVAHEIQEAASDVFRLDDVLLPMPEPSGASARAEGEQPRKLLTAEEANDLDRKLGISLPGQNHTEHFTLDPNDQTDAVVARFIDYDIGKLTGTAGKAAHDAFHRLGSAAVPSLVRGLNMSGRIAASCPVIVIRRKLTASLNESDDPELWQYALQHVGDGVPAHAPHFGAIQQLRSELRSDFYRTQIANLIKRGMLSDVEIAQAMRHPNAQIRLATLTALQQAAPTDAMALLPSLCDASRDEDIEIREAATKAMRHQVRSQVRAALGNHRSSDIADMLSQGVSDRLRCEILTATQGVACDSQMLLLVPRLAALTEDVNSQVRERAEAALGAVFKHHLPPLAQTRKYESLRKYLHHDHPAVRKSAVGAVEMECLSPLDGPLLQMMLALLEDPQSDVRFASQKALAALPGRTKPQGRDLDDPVCRGQVIADWEDWWENEIVGYMEHRARQKLRLALMLEEGGRHNKAREWYREIVDEFPGTLAAQQVEQKLQQAGGGQ